MPMYNNLNGYNNRADMMGTGNTAWGNGYDALNAANRTVPVMPTQPQMPVQQSIPADARTFVNGRQAADNYPMPQGVNVLPLFDRSGTRLYIKAYDNNGYPSVVEDYDLVRHVEPEPPHYATVEDIRAIVEEILNNRSGRQYHNEQKKGVEK